MMDKTKTSLYSGHWIEGAGPIDAEILLVGRDPGANEVREGEPFVGPAGKMLQECVKEAGLDWTKLRRTNAIRCRPPENRKPTEDELTEYRPWLLEEIASMPNLKVIVCLGNESMWTVTKKSGITDKRGEEMWGPISEGLDRIHILPAFHPSYVLHKRTARPTLVKDLVRARRLAAGEALTDPGSAVFTGSLPAFAGERVGVDVETNEHDRPRIVGVGSVPQSVFILMAAQAKRSFDGIRPSRWLGHFIRADQGWLRTLGIDLEGPIEDTSLKAHLLNENRSMGLKKLGLELLDPELYWKFVEPRLRKASTRGTIDLKELGEYCADDVATTLLIDDILTPQLAAEPRLEAIYRHMSLPLSNVLLEVESHGVLFNKTKAEDLAVDARARKVPLENELTRLSGHTINWGSSDQVADLLYNKLGLRPPYMTDTGARGSTDEKALMKLYGQHPVIGVQLKWRHEDKRRQIIESWLKRQKADGRVYPTYNQTGAVTYRLSGHDPNPQNVPTEDSIRSLIIAPSDYVIMSADYKTIELGVGAWIFNEPTMLAAYNAGEDLHILTATNLLGRPPANKDERKKYGKTPNFGLLYQQRERGFQEYAAKHGVDMTLAEASAMRAAWHSMYPGIREGWRTIGLEMKKNGGTMTSPSGGQRRLPEFLSGNQMLVNEAWRVGCNFPVQRTAAEFTHIAAILGAPALRSMFDAWLILHVHDSLVFEVPRGRALAAAKYLRHVMEADVPAYFEWRFGTHIPIPIRVDIGIGPSWGQLVDETKFVL